MGNQKKWHARQARTSGLAQEVCQWGLLALTPLSDQVGCFVTAQRCVAQVALAKDWDRTACPSSEPRVYLCCATRRR